MHLYITPHASWLPEYIQETYKILIEWPETNSLQWILPSSWSGSWEICTCLGLSLFDWFSLYGSLAVVVPLWWGVFCICFDCCMGEIQDHVEMSRKQKSLNCSYLGNICWVLSRRRQESWVVWTITFDQIFVHNISWFSIAVSTGAPKKQVVWHMPTWCHMAPERARERERERQRPRNIDI